MKKINIFLLILLTFTIQSCLKDDEDKFPVSAAERMEQRLIENEAALLSAANGWLMKYYPQEDQEYGGYNFFVKFKDENKVDVMSERGGSEKIVESFYSLTGDNGPVLRFDTHNDLFHYFAEPKNPDGIGPADSGMQGDYEFMILEATPEKVMLKGKKTGNIIIMVPVDENVSWSEKMGTIIGTGDLFLDYIAFICSYNGNESDVSISYRTLTFSALEEGGSSQFASFIVTEDGIELHDPIKIGSVDVSSFKWITEANHFLNEETGAILTPTAPPLSVQVLSSSWYFAYSGTEGLMKQVWDVVKGAGLDPNGITLGAMYLGAVSGDYALAYIAKKPNESFAMGAFFINTEVVDGNTLMIAPTGYIGGTANEYYSKYFFKLFFQAIGGTYKLTSDDPLKPTWIRFENTEEPTIAFTLYKEFIEMPYDN